MSKEQRNVRNIAVTTLGDGGTYATVFYWDEVPLGITAEKFKELIEKGGVRRVEIFDLNMAAKVVFDKQFKQFVDLNESAFARVGALVVGRALAERYGQKSGNPVGRMMDKEIFERDMQVDVDDLLDQMEKEGIAFGDLENIRAA